MVPSALRFLRTQAVMVIVVVLGLVAAGAVTLLDRNADASSHAQAQIVGIELHLGNLEDSPISATLLSGTAHAAVVKQLKGDITSMSSTLEVLLAGQSPPASLLKVRPAIAATQQVVQHLFAIGAGSPSRIAQEFPMILSTVKVLQVKGIIASELLTQAERTYNQRAATAKRDAILGSIATILVLLSIFVLFYRQAKAARAEVVRLLAASRDEASTDPLTSIGNRRAFKRDLERLLPGMDHGSELMVGMLDLDGFKVYNDTFGHAAGDALLARLAGRFKASVAGSATAYRMGGDEFCLLAQADASNGERLLRSAVSALTDTGEGWHIGCSWGVAWMPSEATGGSEALALADERMYAQKTSRTSAGVQTTAALVQVLAERDVTLSAHTSRVAELASATAESLELAEAEVARIGLAGQLHDIGKTAIPESILSKPSALNEDEWAFMRRHTLIGERIIAAAPSLAHTANLVRSSHEWVDGTGYPDGLAGEAIPLGSRIIAVCDAYDAMVAPRPYRSQCTPVQATLELRRCAGTQFDPAVVDAFCAIRAEIDPIADQAVPVVD